MTDSRFSAEPTLRGLMGFQRDSVEHVFSELHRPGGSGRYLVADETGLGKSIVARGLVAKTIEKLQDDPDVDRIDIVYICSNMDLARQNIGRLNVTAEEQIAFSSRLTLLGQHSHRLNNRDGRDTVNGKLVNLISFTPSTSFDPGHQGGQAYERALLVIALRELLDLDRRGRDWTTKLLRGGVSSVDRMQQYVREMESWMSDGIDPEVLRQFAQIGNQRRGGKSASIERFRKVLAQTLQASKITGEIEGQLGDIIGHMRRDIAKAGISTLQPDLIILDEFQRFRPLLSPNNDAGALAHDLFTEASAKVVLLSATPYKPFTYAEEDEDHATDFLNTIRFLNNETTDDRPRTQAVADELGSYRRAVVQGESAEEEAQRASELLLTVMCRNERPRIDERSMLELHEEPADELRAEDLAGYVRLQRLARLVDTRRSVVGVDYWKSAAYFLTFCDGYRLRQRIKECTDPGLGRALRLAQHITKAQVDQRVPIDLGNARLRRLGKDFLEPASNKALEDDKERPAEIWRMLWMPPSLPYLEPDGPFAKHDIAEVTKRLVFSSWMATPASVASLLSYEVERRIASEHSETIRGKQLDYKGMSETGHPKSMTTLLLFWPIPGLAELADPRGALRTAGTRLTPSAFLDSFRQPVRLAFSGTSSADSREDDARRTWQAAFAHESAWPTQIDTRAIANAMTPPTKSATIEHQREERAASELLLGHVHYAEQLRGDAPALDEADLDRLLEVGAFSPGNVCWRVLRRLIGNDDEVSDDGLLVAAAALAGGLRTLFNRPVPTALVRSACAGLEGDLPYWRQVLAYIGMGNLEAVLEEWLFQRKNERGRHFDDESLLSFARDEAAAMSLRTATLSAFDASAHGSEDDSVKFPLQFAVRYGGRSQRGGDDARLPEVRASFNSPFWPFVLVSTSVGQEGIDFHWWCHALTHWNTPANPVDFEQREGRIDRFRGHAIRKNVAEKHGAAALASQAASPWTTLFELAQDLRPEYGHFVPDWVYPGSAKIQRHVSPYPLSKDTEQYERVTRDVAVYRLTLGQPRQEDMVALLRHNDADGAAPARINLSPGSAGHGQETVYAAVSKRRPATPPTSADPTSAVPP